MNDLYIEVRRLNKHTSLEGDLVHHMSTRYFDGRIAIVSEDPALLMKSIKKLWTDYIREVQHERRRDTPNNIRYMRSLTFSSQNPAKDVQANISFSTLEEFRLLPPMCGTLYVTCKVSKQDMYMITSWMQMHSLVVVYK